MQNNTIAQPGDNSPMRPGIDVSVNHVINSNLGQDATDAIAEAMMRLVEDGLTDEVQTGKGTLKVTVEFIQD